MKKDFDKVVRGGKVAVLISPGYGAGWYTWNTSFPQCLFDPDVVAWVEGGKVGPVPDLQAKYGIDYFCDLGANNLEIVWISQLHKFRVQEYDGHESLVFPKDEKWITA